MYDLIIFTIIRDNSKIQLEFEQITLEVAMEIIKTFDFTYGYTCSFELKR